MQNALLLRKEQQKDLFWIALLQDINKIIKL
jgi:hypothetical protein